MDPHFKMKDLMFLYIRVLFVAVLCELHVNALAQMKLVGIISAGTNDILELYTTGHITDLNRYGIGVSDAEDGSAGKEYTFPDIEVPANRFIYASRQTQNNAQTFLGCFPIYHFHTRVASFTGQEFVELFYNGDIVDVFGNNSGETQSSSWKYLKGWAMRLNATGPDGPTWSAPNWKVYNDVYRVTSLNHATVNLPYPIASYYEGGIAIENQRKYSCPDQKPVVELTTTAPLRESSEAVSLQLGTTVGIPVTATTEPGISSPYNIDPTQTMAKATAPLETEHLTTTTSQWIDGRSYVKQTHVKSQFLDQTVGQDNEQTGQMSYLPSNPGFTQNGMFTYSATPVKLYDSLQSSIFSTASPHHPAVDAIDGNEVQFSHSIISTKSVDASQFTILTKPVVGTTIESTPYSKYAADSKFVSDTASSIDNVLQTSMQAFRESNADFSHPITSLQENSYLQTYNMFVKPTSVQVTPSLAYASPEYLDIKSPTTVVKHTSVTSEHVNPYEAPSISELIEASNTATKSELNIYSVAATSISPSATSVKIPENSLTTDVYPVETETQYKQTDERVSLSYSNPIYTQYFVDNNPSDTYNIVTTKGLLTTISTRVTTTPSSSIFNQVDTIPNADTSHRHNYSLDVVLYPRPAKIQSDGFQRAKRIEYEPEEAEGAVGIGSVWLIVLIATICFLFLIDLNTYYTHIKTAIRDIRSFIRYLRNKTFDLNRSRSQVTRLDMSPTT